MTTEAPPRITVYGTPAECVATRDVLRPRVYHHYLPSGENWNWETKCGRVLAAFLSKTQALKTGVRPCMQCYPEGDA